jgi:REP element-mobilizing transposase RayT
MEAVRDGECRFGRYRLHSFVVMPNHVHLMVTAHAPLARWLGSLKGFTAHAANQILGLTGRPFWQDESFDHVVRSERELERIRAYIEENPVRAGLAAAAREFPWSSASLGGVYRPPEGGVVSS